MGGRRDVPNVLLGLGGVTEEELDFGRAEVLGINLNKDVLGVGLVVAFLLHRAALALPLDLNAVCLWVGGWGGWVNG